MTTTDSTTTEVQEAVSDDAPKRTIKLVVWDLDNTLWEGTLLEGTAGDLRPGVKEALKTLDQRGILHSIASKNEPGPALERLRELGVDHYFLYPQIGWSAKSGGLEKIISTINIGNDAVAFLDDQPFERDEVTHRLPEVMVLDENAVQGLTDRPELMPRFITDESAIRRKMYQADAERNQAQEEYSGPEEEFLRDLEMKFTLSPARREDLQRAEELTVRTNQLNATGVTYSYDELDAFRQSSDHLLLVASLDDRYGTYGKIGLALVEKGAEIWNIRLLLMSCRVMSRGVGTVLLSHLLHLAHEAGVRLQAELRKTDRNRMMRITYRFAGFQEVERRGDIRVLENDLSNIQPFPDYVDVRIEGAEASDN